MTYDHFWSLSINQCCIPLDSTAYLYSRLNMKHNSTTWALNHFSLAILWLVNLGIWILHSFIMNKSILELVTWKLQLLGKYVYESKSLHNIFDALHCFTQHGLDMIFRKPHRYQQLHPSNSHMVSRRFTKTCLPRTSHLGWFLHHLSMPHWVKFCTSTMNLTFYSHVFMSLSLYCNHEPFWSFRQITFHFVKP